MGDPLQLQLVATPGRSSVRIDDTIVFLLEIQDV